MKKNDIIINLIEEVVNNQNINTDKHLTDLNNPVTYKSGKLTETSTLYSLDYKLSETFAKLSQHKKKLIQDSLDLLNSDEYFWKAVSKNNFHVYI